MTSSSFFTGLGAVPPVGEAALHLPQVHGSGRDPHKPVIKPSMSESNDLYHERQRLALCAVHSVNNLLQEAKFTKRDFDDACETLSPDSSWHISRNPHRSVLRIGDFDVNVVTYLLQQEGLSVTWHDQRNELQVDALQPLKGILWNVPAESFWGRLFRGRHWVALLKLVDGSWANLDSNLSSPEIVGQDEDCVKLIQSKEDAHILLVSKEDSSSSPTDTS
jgi:hypothetical protein